MNAHQLRRPETKMDLKYELWTPRPRTPRPKPIAAPCRTRRSHPKSRKGCRTCKQRHLKCDEAHPVCDNCDRTRRKCTWERGPLQQPPTPQFTAVESPPPLAPAESEGQLGCTVFASHIARMADAAAASASTANSLVYLLHHFETTAAATISSTSGQRVMKTRVPRLTAKYPFLLHGVIAYSASHLKHLGHHRGAPLTLTTRFHASRALSLYSARLHRTMPTEEVDAMFAACLLLTSLFFVDERPVNSGTWTVAAVPTPPSPSSSWSTTWMTTTTGPPTMFTGQPVSQPVSHPASQFAGQDSTCRPHSRWITILSGLSTLLRSQPAWDPSDSIWSPFLRDAMTTQGHDACDFAYLPAELVRVCPPSSDKYGPELEILGAMIRARGDPHQFPRLVSFPSRFRPGFTDLVDQQDTGALLILCHWFALMQAIPHWWCLTRVRRECLALCQQLQTNPDPRVVAALGFPLRLLLAAARRGDGDGRHEFDEAQR